MKNYLLFNLLILFGLSACDSSVQYDVYVKNSTAENLQVVYKSPNDINGSNERAITLKVGEMKKIIETPNLVIPDSTNTTPYHCKHVAEYVHAFRQDSVPSKLKWCDKNIKFEKEDIGQAVFTIEYTAADF